MPGYYSIVRYYPDLNRDEGFNIGLMLYRFETEDTWIRFSEKKIKRIDSFYSIPKSKLLRLSKKEFNEKLDFDYLSHLSLYEDGKLRYTEPKIIVAENFCKKLEQLYLKYVAHYNEEI